MRNLRYQFRGKFFGAWSRQMEFLVSVEYWLIGDDVVQEATVLSPSDSLDYVELLI
ncbi:MAG: hypothetical protein NVSMB6_23000 [Burkholderiaceae bacterium]